MPYRIPQLRYVETEAWISTATWTTTSMCSDCTCRDGKEEPLTSVDAGSDRSGGFLLLTGTERVIPRCLHVSRRNRRKVSHLVRVTCEDSSPKRGDGEMTD